MDVPRCHFYWSHPDDALDGAGNWREAYLGSWHSRRICSHGRSVLGALTDLVGANPSWPSLVKRDHAKRATPFGRYRAIFRRTSSDLYGDYHRVTGDGDHRGYVRSCGRRDAYLFRPLAESGGRGTLSDGGTRPKRLQVLLPACPDAHSIFVVSLAEP